ncbi:alpha/beta fold hydrolase [Streptomyces coeruleorubidus]
MAGVITASGTAGGPPVDRRSAQGRGRAQGASEAESRCLVTAVTASSSSVRPSATERRQDVPRRGRWPRSRGHRHRRRLLVGLHRRRHQVLTVSRRPPAAAAFEETVTAAAWKTKPSWALVAGADQAINPDVERFGAERAGATVVEIEGASHAVAVSRPKDVADLIRDAVRATS